MMKVSSQLILSFVLLAMFELTICSSQAFAAQVLFMEDFESDLSNWTSNYSGVIVNDPLESDYALSFSRLTVGGDIFSQYVNNPTGEYILEFDYLGMCGGTDCGGYIGHDPGATWLAGTGRYSGSGGIDNFHELPDTGQWEHIVISFSGPTDLRIMVEDWSESGGVAGDVYFDNIKLSAVPIPAAVWLFGSGLIGLVGLARRKKA